MNKTIQLESHSPEETERIGEKLASRLSGDEVIALCGGLGMGKDQLCPGAGKRPGNSYGCVQPDICISQ